MEDMRAALVEREAGNLEDVRMTRCGLIGDGDDGTQ